MSEQTMQFPTPLHAAAVERVQDYFQGRPGVDTILLSNSAARGLAVPGSDLDFAILLAADLPGHEAARLEGAWLAHLSSDATLIAFRDSGRFTQVHLDLIDGRYFPLVWDDGGGPDAFEIEIGNHLYYSQTLGSSGPHYAQLINRWLPYYDEDLREQRLKMVHAGCLYDLAFIPFYTERELVFQAFDRLYRAFQEFLQLLFIYHRRYPLTYNKWIYEQVADGLGQHALFERLKALLAIPSLDGPTLVQRGQDLTDLVTQIDLAS
jgi:hypothetical protein